jgi:hypothetical protein
MYIYCTLRKDDHEPLDCGGTAAPSSDMIALSAPCSGGVKWERSWVGTIRRRCMVYLVVDGWWSVGEVELIEASGLDWMWQDCGRQQEVGWLPR